MSLLDRILKGITDDVDPGEAEPEYLQLYESESAPLDGVFAVLHEKLNGHFKFMNYKMNQGRHFNAEDSRQLLEVMREISSIRKSLKRVGVQVTLRDDYQSVISKCNMFLVHSGGSTIPDDMDPIEIERFEPVLFSLDRAPQRKGSEPQALTLVGEGSFAIVHRFEDEMYGIPIAVKRAKPNISDRDLERFRSEFALLKEIRFPYIVEAYRYDEDRNSFTMEFCDETLGEYIRRNNSTLPWATRKRVALQFLYALNYLHQRGTLHRDISRSNVLIKHFDRGAVQVKLSDFGLHKLEDSEFTRTETELKGSVIDPALESFKNFAATNDIYAAGMLVSFIFTGRVALGASKGAAGQVVAKATHSDPAPRYQNVAEMIVAVEALDLPESSTLRDSPA